MTINIPLINHLFEVDKNSNFIFLLDSSTTAKQIQELSSSTGKNCTLMNMSDSPRYYNPMNMSEADLNNILPLFLKATTTEEKLLLSSSIKILKTVYKDETTLLDLNALMNNPTVAEQILKQYKLLSLDKNGFVKIENRYTLNFLYDYIAILSDNNFSNPLIANTLNMRLELQNFLSCDYINKFLNPPRKDSDRYNEYEQFKNDCKSTNTEATINFLTDKENTVQIILLEDICKESKTILDYMYEDIKNKIVSKNLNKATIPSTYIFSSQHRFLFT